MLIHNLGIFILLGIVIFLSGHFLVKSLHKISRFIGISEFTSAFIIMAFATSIPELFVGISSALKGTVDLAIGNLFGSNLIDITIITGIFIVMNKGIKLKAKHFESDSYYMILGILLMFILYFIEDFLSRTDGAILILFFIFNTARMIGKRKKHFKRETKKQKSIEEISAVKNILIFVFAIIILFFSSSYMVKYASLIAIDLNVSQIVIGLFLVSLATTLPELFFGINAVSMKHSTMSIGDQDGAVLLKVTLIVGLMALISPIKINLNSFIISGIAMFISALLFTYFVKTGKELSIWEGVILILFYILFVIVSFI